MPRALVFFPHNPFPPRSGAHQRCLQIIHGLATLGFEVTLASSQHTSETSWAGISELEWREAEISALAIHQPTIWDRRAIKYEGIFNARFNRASRLDSFNYAPPGLIRWFRKLAETINPDLVLVNYAFWGRLVSSAMHRRSLTIMDTLDLVSLYRSRFLLMERYLPESPIAPEGVDPGFLQEDLFDKQDFGVSAEEFQILDRFGATLAITPADAALIAGHTQHTRVVTLPMTQKVYQTDHAADGAALYTAGRNPFNVQGYLYFAARVLPRVLREQPSFCLHVTGKLCDDVQPVPGVELCGFVTHLDAEYAHAPFLICPVLGKTGQQIKIVEAMAHGVPVIATRAAAEGSPIQHNINGLIARDSNEFAEHVVRLWQDRERCKQMGKLARETIARDFSQEILLNTLGTLVDRRSG